MASGGSADSGLSPRVAAVIELFGHPCVDALAKLVRDDPHDTAGLAALERAERRLDLVKAFVAAADVKLARRRRELATAGHAAPVDHHRIHEGRWKIDRDPARTVTLNRPDGTVEHHGPSINRRPVKVA